MRDRNDEITEKLDAFADWLEGANNVHCSSLPRRAAIVIRRLEEENHQMRLQLNKEQLTISEMYDRYMGRLRLFIYIMGKKWKRN